MGRCSPPEHAVCGCHERQRARAGRGGRAQSCRCGQLWRQAILCEGGGRPTASSPLSHALRHRCDLGSRQPRRLFDAAAFAHHRRKHAHVRMLVVGCIPLLFFLGLRRTPGSVHSCCGLDKVPPTRPSRKARRRSLLGQDRRQLRRRMLIVVGRLVLLCESRRLALGSPIGGGALRELRKSQLCTSRCTGTTLRLA